MLKPVFRTFIKTERDKIKIYPCKAEYHMNNIAKRTLTKKYEGIKAELGRKLGNHLSARLR